MAHPRILTIFGATGTQGGSVIDVILAHPNLKQKYTLRGITRDASSKSAVGLSESGVAMVSANINDVESLRKAIRGSYGVFGVTNFVRIRYPMAMLVDGTDDYIALEQWDKEVMSKDKEIQQGRNIFEACRSEGVKHYIFSTLPYAAKISGGKLSHVSHFDSKAIVAEEIEAEKGDMIVSFFMPAMYYNSVKGWTKMKEGKLTLSMPFKENGDFAWPLIEPRSDSGKYIAGLFEGESSANGVFVHGVSVWTSPADVVAATAKVTGKDTVFRTVTPEEFQSSLPEEVGEDLKQTCLLVGRHNYYGDGQEKDQAQHDKWLIDGATKTGLEDTIRATGPWNF